MRKIKITALVLAVLMVVTAFAGCASKSTVENLDAKVEDLDGKIKDQSEALTGIESTLKSIQDALKGQSSSDLDAIKKDVDANKQSFEDIKKSLEALQKSIEEAQKKADDADKKADAAAGNDAAVKAAISKAGAQIDSLKGAFEDAKANYTEADIAAIREIYGDARASISACTTEAAVKTALEDMQKKLDEHKAVNEKLYNYIVELKGNITDDSAKKVAEAVEARDEAIEFYTNGRADLALKEYGKDKIDLCDEIDQLEIAQNTTLEDVKARAAALDKKIDEIDASLSFQDVTNIYAEYQIWKKDAEKLSPKNTTLVKNYDKLVAAQKSSLNNETAMTMFKAETLSSKIRDGYYDIFYDYDQLLVGNTFDQVVFTYTNKDAKEALTSEIYAAIDAKIAAWAKEYELTDAAVEYIINSVKGANYYAKYKSDKALTAAFEAEYTKLVAASGIFSNIKALNSKKLSADAVEVMNSYKKNAADINAWRDALIKAYETELKTVENVQDARNIFNSDRYTKALTKNFNAMVIRAKLCANKINPGTQKPITDQYEDYGLGFLTIVSKDEVQTGNEAYYYKLYNFTDVKLVDFIKVTFPAAQAAADAINKKIENYNASQALSIKDIMVGIGGYVKFDGADKLVANSKNDILAILAANGTPKTIAEFVYAYKTSTVYDLSSMINVAEYDKKVADVEKIIKAADAAAANLSDAYSSLVGEKDVAVITTTNAAKAQSVYKLLVNWMTVANDQMEIATLINTTSAGVKEYKLTTILSTYEKIAPTTVRDTSTGSIVALKDKADKILAEEALVVSIYQMMDKVYAWDNSNAFGYDNSANNGAANATMTGTRTKFNTQGVVDVTISATPMAADGQDASGKAYLKDMYLWTIEYVTFDKNSNKFKTDKFTGYYYTNNKNSTATAKDAAGKTIQENFLSQKLWKESSVINTSTNANYVTTLFETVPNKIKTDSIWNSFATLNFSGKAIPSFVLPVLAMSFEGKFTVDNLGTTDKVTAAKKSWDPENGGYGYMYIKALTNAFLTANGVTYNSVQKEAYKAASNLSQLKIVVNSDIMRYEADNKVKFGKAITFGVANDTWMSTKLDLDKDGDNVNFTDFGYDRKDFKADGIVIYSVCDHTALIAATCDGVDATCPECGAVVVGTKVHNYATPCAKNCSVCGAVNTNRVHSAPIGTTCASQTSYVCEVCQEIVAITHDFAITADWTVDGNDNTKYYATVTQTCNKCAAVQKTDSFSVAYVDVDSSLDLSDNDTVTITMYLADGTQVKVSGVYATAAFTATATVVPQK